MIKTPESETSGCVFETLQNFYRHPLLLCTKTLCTCNQSFNCLFVCLGFFISLEKVSLIWRRHHYRWRAAQFVISLALMSNRQWGFFRVSHLLWHGTSVYNGQDPWHSHLLPSVWWWSCHYQVFTTKFCRSWNSNSQPSACGENALTNCATTAALSFVALKNFKQFISNKYRIVIKLLS